MERKTYLLKNIVLFALNVLGVKLISFLLVPLYTNTLSPSEYGIIDFIVTIGTIFIPIITCNIGEAVMRFSLDKDADFAEILTVGIIISISSLIFGLLAFIPSSLIESISAYKCIVYGYCIMRGLSQIYMLYLRGREKLLSFAIGNILQACVAAILNIYFLLFLKIGIKGYFLAFIISDSIVFLYALIVGNVVCVFRRLKLNKILFRKMIRYSIFLVPNSIMWWIIDSSDRIMVTSIIGTYANGLYSIAYKIPTVAATVASVFNQAWTFSAIHEAGDESEEQINNKMFAILVDLLLVFIALLLVSIKYIFRIYVSEEFYKAWIYIPILLVGFLFNSLGTFYSIIYTVHKDSKGFLYSAMIGALANVVLNFVLIPKFALFGAAVATAFSFLAVFIFRMFNTRKYLHLNILKTNFFIGLAILIFLAILVSLGENWALYLQFVLLFLLSIITRKSFYKILGLIKWKR